MPVLLELFSYLQKKQAQMQYPTYQAAGRLIDSGMVESADGVMVEVQMKGAGMHW